MDRLQTEHNTIVKAISESELKNVGSISLDILYEMMDNHLLDTTQMLELLDHLYEKQLIKTTDATDLLKNLIYNAADEKGLEKWS